MTTDEAPLEFELTARQRRLIQEYGYPFEALELQLKKLDHCLAAGTVAIGKSYFDHLLGDLSRSAGELADTRVLAELDELYVALQIDALRQGHRAGG